MGLDFDQMRRNKEAAEKQSGGEVIYMKQGDIGTTDNPTIFRLVDIPDYFQGVPYFTEKGYWLGGSNNRMRIVSPSTFGDPDPVREQIDAGLASEGWADSVRKVMDSKAYDDKDAYFFIGYVLDVQYNNGQISEYTFNEKPVILQCTTMLKDSIVDQFLKPRFQNDSPNGLADNKVGFPLELTKKPKTAFTEYTADAIAQQIPVPDHLANKVPNLYKMIRKKVPSAEYQIAAIRHVLYGEAKPSQTGQYYFDEQEQAPSAPQPTQQATPAPAPQAAPAPQQTQNQAAPTSAPQAPQQAPAPAQSQQPTAPAAPQAPQPPKQQQAPASNPAPQVNTNQLLQDLGDIGDLPE